jgi:hypothetical protein
VLTRPATWLVIVAAAVTAIGITVSRHSALSFDETVYLSQTNPRVPALFFSAPRSRGVPLVVAPLVWATSSAVALRVYLAVVAGVGVVAAYWPWLRLARSRWSVPLAALIFTGLWVVLYYSNRAMPNMYVAFGSVAAVGWTLRYVADRSRRALVGMAAGLAVVALARPGDAFWLAVPLFVAVLAMRSLRRPAPAGAMVTGLVAGVAPWVIEAFVRFGGPLERLRQASHIEGGMGWRPVGLTMELHAVNGPALCRPCTPGIGNVSMSLWWLAIPAIVAGGLLVAARAGHFARAALPAACGASIAVPYALMVGYAAPRFLIPAYALFAIPAAELPIALVRAVPPRLRPVAAGGVGCLLAVQLAGQLLVLERRAVGPSRTSGYAAVAARLRGLGIRPPCVINGQAAFPVAYYAGCSAVQTSGRYNGAVPVSRFLARARSEPTAIVTQGRQPPAYAGGWRPHRLTPGDHGWFAYLPP